MRISARSGEGIAELLELFASRARDALRPGEPALVSRERHVQALHRALEPLERVLTVDSVEFLAEELRLAARQLASVIGIVGPEDVLGEIFGRFCIGK